MTPQRMEEIDTLVEKWEEGETERQIAKQGYCDTTAPLDDIDPSCPEHKKRWAEAALQMGITPEELTAWDKQAQQEDQKWNRGYHEQQDVDE